MMVVLSGLAAGLIHVFSGPDHLAALAPISTSEKRSHWWLGLHWGAGHALGVMLVGVAGWLLRGLLPIDLLSSWAERLVGLLLIVIGLWGMRRALRAHTHSHTHGPRVHSHFHVHWPRSSAADRHAHGHAVLGIGVLHGMAGGSHLLGVLPALALPSMALSAGYLLAYAIGTILAMTSFASVIGLAVGRLSLGQPHRYQACLLGSSGAALLVGLFWLVS